MIQTEATVSMKYLMETVTVRILATGMSDLEHTLTFVSVQWQQEGLFKRGNATAQS